MSVGLLTVLWLAVVPLVWGAVTYNRLVALRNGQRNAFAQIDVQLKRRHDLVPGLLNVARAHLSHERETLHAVVSARQRASEARVAAARRPTQPGLLRQLDGAEQDLSRSMASLLAVVEDYPELKADRTLADLTETLTSTENRIGFARQAFNDAVTDYNVAVERFPARLVATLCGFRCAPLLHATRSAPEREPVPVVL
jgi:LemA protein